VIVSVVWCWASGVLGFLEVQDDVGRRSARESNTIVNVVPSRTRVHNVCECLLMNIDKLRLLESLHWNKVRLIHDQTDKALLGTTWRFRFLPVAEVNLIEISFRHPGTV
jgi:hypothetical protein